jgi:hypothetical protein
MNGAVTAASHCELAPVFKLQPRKQFSHETANNTHTLCIGSNGRAVRTPVALREGNPLTFA